MQLYIYIYACRYLDLDISSWTRTQRERDIYIYNIMSQTEARKERPRERGSIRWLQSGSTKARLVGALCIWQVDYEEGNVNAGMRGCQGESCGMIMVRAS